MFSSVLIANRGEIACRIIRTCRRLGLRTIAVHSAADRGAPHVRLADERHDIGPAEATRSYLDAEAIIAAALAHGAEAIHPGYGFLAEKTVLPDLCARHGLIWIGPRREVIAQMGSKIEAKRIAREAGVLTVPGYDGAEQGVGLLAAEAEAIGFPVLIKASAGGGGKGMRRVESAGDFAATLDLVRREAKASFGDDRVLLEKYITRPRHLEVQIAGDKHGNLVHLFERECSIQRHFQKIIEEAPAAHLAPQTREKLYDAALRLGRATIYDSLGTVEFILDAAGGSEPYFLEVNTRLQVEHPVTEAVTGIDLVELQMRIAAGETLPLRQAEIGMRGAAIEARVNAEDPAAAFRPELGRITLYREPEDQDVRIDSGIQAGSTVTPYYDSLLAKVIASGPDRASAVRRLTAALERYVILGVGTNIAFLRALVAHPAFASQALTTRYIDEVFPGGWPVPAIEPWYFVAAAAATLLPAGSAETAPAPGDAWQRLAGFRVLGRGGAPGRAPFEVAAATGETQTVFLTARARGLQAEIAGEHYEITRGAAGEMIVHAGPSSRIVPFAAAGGEVDLFAAGRSLRFTALPRVEALAAAARPGQSNAADIVTAMPGLVTEVTVSVGQKVRRNEILVVLEAMKLVHSLTAAADGIVRAVHCEPGQTVAGGTRLVEIEPA